MYRVFLVEDSQLVRERLTAFLQTIEGVDPVGSAATARDAEQAILASRPDAVLLDIKLAQVAARAPHFELGRAAGRC